jgi:hypothetical protein
MIIYIANGTILHDVKYDYNEVLEINGGKVARTFPQILPNPADIKAYKEEDVIDRYARIGGEIVTIEKYESAKNAIRMDKYIDNDNVFHPGYTYTFTMDGTNYDELLRRASCTWDSKKNAMEWILEFGKGQTFGRERMFRSGQKHDASINELKLR